MARLRTATATSAGGVVVRHRKDVPQLVVGMRRRERDSVTWTLPKGTPDPGETREETALREVREETGLDVRIVAPLDSIEYRFVQHGTRIHKTVHYYLMEVVGGDLGRHDHEFADVRWIDFSDAPHLLTFETERALVSRAAERIRGSSTAPEIDDGMVTARSAAGRELPVPADAAGTAPSSVPAEAPAAADVPGTVRDAPAVTRAGS